MDSADLTALRLPGSEPVTDASFAARLAAARKLQSPTQQQLTGFSGAHVPQIRRYETGTTPPTQDVLPALALALNVSTDSLLVDQDERGLQSQPPRLELADVDRLTPDGQEHGPALVEGALLRRHAFSGRAS